MSLNRRELLISGAALVGAAALGVGAGVEIGKNARQVPIDGSSPEAKRPEIPPAAAYFLDFMMKYTDMQKQAEFWNSFRLFSTQAKIPEFSDRFIFSKFGERLDSYSLYWPQSVVADKGITPTVFVSAFYEARKLRTLGIQARINVDGTINPDRSDRKKEGVVRWGNSDMDPTEMLKAYDKFFPRTTSKNSAWTVAEPSTGFALGFQYRRQIEGEQGVRVVQNMKRDGFARLDITFPRPTVPTITA